MTRFLAIAALVLWVGTAAVIGKMVVSGHTRPGDDGRTAILLPASDRDFVLAEMRGLLQAVQGVTAAMAAKDSAAAAQAARAAGGAVTHHMPATLMTALPLEFKQMGLSVHSAFDELAAAAAGGEPAEWQGGRLARILETCVACHQLYRLEAK